MNGDNKLNIQKLLSMKILLVLFLYIYFIIIHIIFNYLHVKWGNKVQWHLDSKKINLTYFYFEKIYISLI